LPRLAPGAFFSHITAAELYGFPLPRSLQNRGDIHVSVVAPQHAPQGRGVIGHRLSSAGPAWEQKGLRALPPPETFSQLGLLLTYEELVIVGDFLVRRKRPFSTLSSITSTVASANRTPGIRRVRAAVPAIRAKTDSPRETSLRLLLIDAGLPEPAINHHVIHEGYFVATPDLCYVAEKIAIEYEGDHHRTNRDVYEDDIIRRELLEAAGWLVIRVINDHIVNRRHWLATRVAQALSARAPRG